MDRQIRPCAAPQRGALAVSGAYVYAAFGCAGIGVVAEVSATYGGAGSWTPLTTLAQPEQFDYNFALAVDPSSSFVVRDCDFVKTWRRTDARMLEVHAEDAFAEGAPGPAVVPIIVTLAGNGRCAVVCQLHRPGRPLGYLVLYPVWCIVLGRELLSR